MDKCELLEKVAPWTNDSGSITEWMKPAATAYRILPS